MARQPLLLLVLLVAGPFNSTPEALSAEHGRYVPIAYALEDKDGDSIPDHLGEEITVEGIVTLGSGALSKHLAINIQDATAGIRVYDQHLVLALEPGDWVAVTGTVTHYNGIEELIKPKLTVLGTKAEIAPKKARLAELNSEKFSGQLVTVKGRLIETRFTSGGTEILIYADGRTGAVWYNTGRVPPLTVPNLEVGSLVRATGIASQQDGEAPYDASYRLIPRSPEDIKVIQGPPLIPRRLWAYLSVAIFALAGASYLWADTLRRRVRRRTAELHLQKQKYEQLVNSIDGIVWECDGQTFQFSFVSEQAERLLGHQVERWLAEPSFWSDTVHPDDRGSAVAWRARAAAGEGPREWEYRMIAADGRPVWVRDSATPIVENKQPAKLRGMLVNITARKQGEEALRQSEGKFRTLFEESKDAIFISTAEWKLLDINRAGVELFGYSSKQELTQVDIATEIRFEPQDRTAFQDAIVSLGFAKDVEFTAKRRDGEELSMLLTATTVRDQQARIVAYRCIARDVTEQKRLEQQLRQSQKMEAIGRLAGGVAHDFNNLLTAITGYSDLMLARLAQRDPLRRHAEEVKKAAERAASLTHQLLAFSRKQLLQPKILDVNAVVADLEKMLRRLIGEDIELVTVSERGLAEVKADPGQIVQVIMNLVVNARDAMPRGGKLTIQAANVDLSTDHFPRDIGARPGPYVMLAVSDTGCGMDADTKSRIFEPFFTTKELGRGTGLGLSTVYGIVKQSDGYIWADSEPGQGSTFKVYLPRLEGRRQTVEQPAASSEQRPGSETVLLVEDEEMVRGLVRDILETSGYTVLEASDAGEALRICERHQGPLDLVLSDVVMPQMSGPELARRLAGLRPGMKVLYMSGYTDAALGDHGVLDPSTPFLQKPFAPDALVRKVRDVLDERAVADAAARLIRQRAAAAAGAAKGLA